jgi:HD-GYP domain-containing protein (c-di-GMP phosphodiesterase class II)
LIRAPTCRNKRCHTILQHGESYDGSGFPWGIKGEAILIEARILGAALALEDLTTHRSYRIAFSLEQALEFISSHSGSNYDPDVVAVCVKLFKEKSYKLAV